MQRLCRRSCWRPQTLQVLQTARSRWARPVWRACSTTAAKADCAGWLAKCRANPTVFVHFGNCIVLLAINQTDMLQLRGLSIGASFFGIAFNMLQPKPLKAPVCLPHPPPPYAHCVAGCVGPVLHWMPLMAGEILRSLQRLLTRSVQIGKLLREQQPLELNCNEELAYDRAFCEWGFTPRHFLDILDAAAPSKPFREFRPAENITEIGTPNTEICALLEVQPHTTAYRSVQTATDSTLCSISSLRGLTLGVCRVKLR